MMATAAKGSPGWPPPSADQLWVPGFRPGDLVIALEREGLASWHAAEVIAAAGDTVMIKWIGLPDSEIVRRRTWEIAIPNLKAAQLGSGS